MTRSVMTGAGLLCALVVAAPAARAGPVQAAPPPPASLDDAGVLAWVEDHIEADGWSVLAADKGAVALAAPSGPKVLEDATLQAEIRQEYFRPADFGPMRSRSNLQVWNVDCRGARMRILAMRIYEGNNLQGSHTERENLQAPWTTLEPGSTPARTAERLCAGLSEGAGPKPGAPSR